MRTVCLSAVALVLVACGSTRPVLSASSDAQGVLTVEGSHWDSCSNVQVTLPAPWGSATHALSGGSFLAVYPVLDVKPYAGRIVAIPSGCALPERVEATTQIKVGDNPRVTARLNEQANSQHGCRALRFRALSLAMR